MSDTSRKAKKKESNMRNRAGTRQHQQPQQAHEHGRTAVGGNHASAPAELRKRAKEREECVRIASHKRIHAHRPAYTSSKQGQRAHRARRRTSDQRRQLCNCKGVELLRRTTIHMHATAASEHERVGLRDGGCAVHRSVTAASRKKLVKGAFINHRECALSILMDVVELLQRLPS